MYTVLEYCNIALFNIPKTSSPAVCLVVQMRKVQRYHIYLDQIMQGYNKQSALSVVAMVEACLDWIAVNIAQLKLVYVQSDQAKCYNSSITKVALGLLNYVKSVRVARYIHSGVQDGKGLLDAHFARARLRTCSLGCGSFAPTGRRKSPRRRGWPRRS